MDQNSFFEYLIKLTNSRGNAGTWAVDNGTDEWRVGQKDIELLAARTWADAAKQHRHTIVSNPHPNPADPPDILAEVDGKQASIELTEFVNGQFLAKFKHENRNRAKPIYSAYHGQGFVDAQWDKQSFNKNLRSLIEGKCSKYAKGNKSFDYLVIYTGEKWLYPNKVADWLSEIDPEPWAQFANIHFLMDYDPSWKNGCHPLFVIK
jgi:hypothetical protein